MKTIFIGIFLLFSGLAFGQQLVYTPKNPNFGGNTFNYQWLLSSANAQNSFKDDQSRSHTTKSELERFQESLNRQILGQLSRTAFSSEFKEGLKEGTFNMGSLVVEIYETGEGLVMNILDVNTGEQTQIIVPN
ncbi:MAG: curli assembly protein CsgF [Arenibacter sp.]|nr:curli assembly protein CsgF [Arenibacter sp.]